MSSIINPRRLERELAIRGLLPDRCRLLEVRMEVNAPIVVRYEVFITTENLGLFADACRAAADEAMADDERNRIAREKSHD